MVPLRQSDTDACPGALRLHTAADGLLARVRLPAGELTGAQLTALRELTEQFGDGFLELTSRANLQVRGVRAGDAETLAARLRAAGLLPSATHDAVRNIAAPPLAGPALRGLVRQLDAAILGDPGLARLPGKFLFAVGHVALAADVAAVPDSAATGPSEVADQPGRTTGPGTSPSDIADRPGRTTGPGTAPSDVTDRPGRATGPGTGPAAGAMFAIRFAGHDTGLRVGAGRVAEVLVAAAHAFLAEREAQRGDGPAAWRLRELADGPARVSARLVAALGPGARPGIELPHETRPGHAPAPGNAAARVEVADDGFAGADAAAAGPADLIGVLAQPGSPLVTVGALVPLGRLGGVPLRVLEKAARLVVTPWRGILVTDLPDAGAANWAADLDQAGLAVAPDSPWVGVTACAGRPGCAKSLADVRADAAAATRFVPGLAVHWVGCARACGSPAGPHVRVEATPDGYAVSRQTKASQTTHETTRTGSPHLGDLVAEARRS